jgi:hypothetical protein
VHGHTDLDRSRAIFMEVNSNVVDHPRSKHHEAWLCSLAFELHISAQPCSHKFDLILSHEADRSERRDMHSLDS